MHSKYYHDNIKKYKCFTVFKEKYYKPDIITFLRLEIRPAIVTRKNKTISIGPENQKSHIGFE